MQRVDVDSVDVDASAVERRQRLVVVRVVVVARFR
jgi:hypothetical protein